MASIPKTLAILTPRVWNSIWGQEKNLIHRLVKHFAVFILDQPDYQLRYQKIGSPYPVPEGATLIQYPTALPIGIRLFFASEWHYLRHLIKHRPSIVISYVTLGGLLAALWARMIGAYFILIYADDLPEFYKRKSPFAGWITRFFFNPIVAKLAHQIIVTASSLKDDLKSYNRHITWIPNGVDLEKFSALPIKSGTQEKPFTIGFVGSFGEWINFDLVLEAAKQTPEFHYLLVGGGEGYEPVLTKTRTLSNVLCTGFLPYELAQSELAKMDVCLIPFYCNRLTDRVSPIKLFEYWAHGKVVISTPTKEIRESAGDAVLFVNTANDLIQALQDLSINPQKMQHIAKLAQERVKEFDWDQLFNRYLHLIPIKYLEN